MTHTRFTLPRLCACALLAFVSSVGAQGNGQDQPAIGGVGITVFSEINFTGTNATLRDNAPDLRRQNLNDRINSLRVARGEMWEACENIEFKGACQVFSGDESDLRRVGWNGRISSLRRLRNNGSGSTRPPANQPRIQLYSGTNYRGDSRTLTIASTGVGGGFGGAQSVRIQAGEWEICEQQRFGGRCQTVRTSVPDVRRLGMDGVMSVRPR